MTPCEEHNKIVEVLHRLDVAIPLLQKDIEYLRRDQETILARFGKHVENAEMPGGRHERLRCAEDNIRALQMQTTNDRIVGRWFMIGSGVIGGLIGSGSVDAVTKFLSLWR
jgi:hypothetical protein